jgi:hypothetical protein
MQNKANKTLAIPGACSFGWHPFNGPMMDDTAEPEMVQEADNNDQQPGIDETTERLMLRRRSREQAIKRLGCLRF